MFRILSIHAIVYPCYIVKNDVASGNHVISNENTDVIESSNSIKESNGSKESNEDDDDDDDDLFCDSLGPELMEEQVLHPYFVA